MLTGAEAVASAEKKTLENKESLEDKETAGTELKVKLKNGKKKVTQMKINFKMKSPKMKNANGVNDRRNEVNDDDCVPKVYEKKYDCDGWKVTELRNESEDDEEPEDLANWDEFNRKMYEKWKESRRRRKEMDEDDWLAGEDGRKKRILEKKMKENHWKDTMMMKEFLEENSDGWKERKKEEVKKTQLEDKEERLRRIKEKQKKFGMKNVKKKESPEEKEELDKKLERKQEMLEIRSNMWRQYRDTDGNQVKMAEKMKVKKTLKKNLEKKDQLLQEEQERKIKKIKEAERKKKKRRAVLLKETWTLMLDCLEDAKNDDEEDPFEKVREKRKVRKEDKSKGEYTPLKMQEGEYIPLKLPEFSTPNKRKNEENAEEETPAKRRIKCEYDMKDENDAKDETKM